jgi:DNA-binding NarL/FixJ family response regulator
MNLLIVDDHVLFRQGISELFNTQPDFSITGEAGSIHEAVEKARLLQPDIVLMDVNLPDGSGLDATRQILDGSPRSSVVFLTISEDDQRLLKAARSGAAGYLLKDMPFSKLADSLRGVYHHEAAYSRTMMRRLVDEYAVLRCEDETHGVRQADLTAIEIEILRELTAYASNKEIADCLVISVATVKYHLHKILARYQLKDRLEAATFARSLGLVKEYPS